VLFGQIDRKLVQDFAGVARECACVSKERMNPMLKKSEWYTKERAIAVHDDETKLAVRLHQLLQGLCVELVIAKIERCVDGLEGLKVDVDLFLLAFVRDDGAAVDNETIVGDYAAGRSQCYKGGGKKKTRRDTLVVQLETLLR